METGKTALTVSIICRYLQESKLNGNWKDSFNGFHHLSLFARVKTQWTEEKTSRLCSNKQGRHCSMQKIPGDHERKSSFSFQGAAYWR